jgi:hypothetical protein
VTTARSAAAVAMHVGFGASAAFGSAVWAVSYAGWASALGLMVERADP